MFFNLAWRNSKRNRSENLIYFLTMVTAIATFYIVLSLGSQDVMRFLEEIETYAYSSNAWNKNVRYTDTQDRLPD